MDVNIYGGPFRFVDDDTGPHWEGPPNWTSTIDFRHTDEVKTDRSDADRPGGLFILPKNAPDPGLDWTLLGSGDPREIRVPGSTKDSWESLYGRRPAGDTLADLILDELQLSNDRPLLPGASGYLKVHLGGEVLISKRFDPNSADPAVATVKTRIQTLYAQAETQGGEALAHKFLGEQMAKLYGLRSHAARVDAFSRSIGLDLIPAADRAGHPGPAPLATTFTDDFSGDLSAWTQDTGTWQVTSNALDKTASGSTYQAIRYSTAFGSEDHDAEGQIIASGKFAGPAIRLNSAAVDCYFAAEFSGVGYLSRLDAASRTDLDTGALNQGVTPFVKIDGDGSSLEAFNGAASPASTSFATATDSNHSFNSVGMQAWATGANLDDFIANGTAAGSAGVNMLLLGVG